MLIKILKDVIGSPYGYKIISYKTGNEYEIPDDLADVFIKMGRAERVEKKEPENKATMPTDNKRAEKEKARLEAEKEKARLEAEKEKARSNPG